jgi:hypothetical protein
MNGDFEIRDQEIGREIHVKIGAKNDKGKGQDYNKGSDFTG